MVIPGQPVSLNHAYQNIWINDRRGRSYKARKRTPVAEQYFNDAVLLMRAAKPSHWEPAGQLRVVYDLYLARSIDADNVLKVLSDALERATGINDERMLPCVWSKVSGLPTLQARVHIEIQELRASPLFIIRSTIPDPSDPSPLLSREPGTSA